MLKNLSAAEPKTSVFFPLRREPTDETLRGELQGWVDEITVVMAEIWTQGVRSATPGVLRDLDAHPAAASSSGSRGRSRSAARQHVVSQVNEGDVTNLMDYGGYGSTGGDDEAEDDRMDTTANDEVEDGEGTEDTGAGVGPVSMGGGLPSMLGPVGTDAVDPPEGRMSELLDREIEHAEQAYMVEVAVREAMYRPNAGTSREVVRRLLQCSQHVSEIQYWLQKALQQARTCPPGRDGGDVSNWREAVEYEGVIWQRVVGLTADDRMVRRLRAVVQQRLRRRAERLADLEARMWPGSSADARPGPYAGGGTRNRPPWRRESVGPRGNTRGDTARPSMAPHLRPRASPDDALPGRRRALHAATLRRSGVHVADPAHLAADPPPAAGPAHSPVTTNEEVDNNMAAVDTSGEEDHPEEDVHEEAVSLDALVDPDARAGGSGALGTAFVGEAADEDGGVGHCEDDGEPAGPSDEPGGVVGGESDDKVGAE